MSEESLVARLRADARLFELTNGDNDTGMATHIALLREAADALERVVATLELAHALKSAGEQDALEALAQILQVTENVCCDAHTDSALDQIANLAERALSPSTKDETK